MLISPIQYTDHTNVKFDFEDFIKEELGLDLNSFTKREGKVRIADQTTFVTQWLFSFLLF
jgi:hypothetical protein